MHRKDDQQLWRDCVTTANHKVTIGTEWREEINCMRKE